MDNPKEETEALFRRLDFAESEDDSKMESLVERALTAFDPHYQKRIFAGGNRWDEISDGEWQEADRIMLQEAGVPFGFIINNELYYDM